MARFSKDGYWDYYRSLPDSLRSREHQLQLLRCGHVINDTGIYERAEYPFTVWEEVISGEGFVSVGDQSFTVRKGDIYVLPRGKCSRLEPHARHTWQKKYFLLSGSHILHGFGAFLLPLLGRHLARDKRRFLK